MQPVWSPDSKHLIFSDKFMKLNLADAESGEITVLDQADYDEGWERWGIQDYVWSPDSRWIAYTKMGVELNDSIYLYSLDEKKSYRLTDGRNEDWSPSFDPEGKYLYFLSNRTYEPRMGFDEMNYACYDMAKPYIMILAADGASPFAPKDSSEEVKEEKKEEKKTDAKEGEAARERKEGETEEQRAKTAEQAKKAEQKARSQGRRNQRGREEGRKEGGEEGRREEDQDRYRRPSAARRCG